MNALESLLACERMIGRLLYYSYFITASFGPVDAQPSPG